MTGFVLTPQGSTLLPVGFKQLPEQTLQSRTQEHKDATTVDDPASKNTPLLGPHLGHDTLSAHADETFGAPADALANLESLAFMLSETLTDMRVASILWSEKKFVPT